MDKNIIIKKLIKISAICLISMLLLGFLTYLIYPKVSIAIIEHKYERSGDSIDLIYLCNLLVDTNEDEKINKYMSKVVNIENFEEAFEKSAINKEGKLDTKTVYSDFLTECMFSYIYTERYDEFIKEFPKLYEKLMQSGDEYIWHHKIAQTKKISKKGYEVIIESLQNICPKLPENITDSTYGSKLILYGKNLVMQEMAYKYMGDEITSYKLHEEWERIVEEMHKKIEEKNNSSN